MINNKNEIVNSIPSLCINYKPDFSKQDNVHCSKLGLLYECINFKGKTKGCLFCDNCIISKKSDCGKNSKTNN